MGYNSPFSFNICGYVGVLGLVFVVFNRDGKE
jgi:hypothetical protein